MNSLLLQGKDKKAQENEDSSLQSDNINQQQQQQNRSSSPTNQVDSIQSNADQDRAVSPQSQQSNGPNQQPARPGSASAKRRSRFLACFGAGHGSVDLLNSGTDESSAGGDSPRQACKEKPVVSRHILGDVNDSDGETRRSSPSPSSLSLNDSTGHEKSLSRKKRHVNEVELVPEDYYIEKEPPLILNIEPKTYGKRLASSSAQTDSKLNVNGYFSTSAKKSKKSRGLLRGKRKNKTQMTIHCDVVSATKPKSAQGDNSNNQSQLVIDSSLDQSVNDGEQQHDANGDHQKQFKDDNISIIQDVITSDDHKWRTCTIQTDSDSVTVNYVTIQPSDGATSNAATATPGIQDDGYVSGSGDINRQSSFGKGLFSLSSAFGGNDKQQASIVEHEKAESKRGRKQRAKSAKVGSKDKATKESSIKKDKGQVKKEQKSISDDEQHQSIDVSSAKDAAESAEIEGVVDKAGSNDNQQDQSGRSVSPTSKELKQKLKLERREKERREKEEKKHQKELEDVAAKAEKLKKKQEKEAKKAEKLAQKIAKKSPPTSVPQTPQPDESLTLTAAAAPQTTTGKTASVKFANTLLESAPESGDQVTGVSASHDGVKQLDSIQRVIENTSSDYEREKERLSQEDGNDMVQMSISEKLEVDSSELSEPKSLAAAATETSELQQSEKLISFSDSEDPSKSPELTQQHDQRDQREPPPTTVQQPLKPILKQQSTSASSAGEGEGEASAEITISEDRKLQSVATKLVSEATEEAVKVANKMKSLSEGETIPEKDDDDSTASKLSKKLEKSKAKKEAKAKLEEEKRLAKEAKKLAKEAEAAKKVEEAEAKKAAKKAKAEQEKLDKEAKIEQDRLAKEAKKKLKEEEAEKQKLSKAEAKKEKEKKKSKSPVTSIEEPEQVSKSEEPASELSLTDPSKTVELSTSVASNSATEPLKSEEAAKIEPNSSQSNNLVETTTNQLDQVVEVVEDEKTGPTNEIGSKSKALVDETTTSKVAVEESSTSTGDDKKEKKMKEKKEKKEKKLKDKKVKRVENESDSTEPLSSASKSSFFGRLFKKRSVPTKSLVESEDKEVVSDKDSNSNKEVTKDEKKPMIMSEMYPSDPDDAESEMILEVNVPKNLLINQQQQMASNVQQQKVELSQASDTAASPTLATTVDESLITSDDQKVALDRVGVKSESNNQVGAVAASEDQDDQATLVNMSQMVTSEVDDHDDDDATENVVSQANELTTQATVDDSMIDSSPVSIRVTSESGKIVVGGEEKDEEKELPESGPIKDPRDVLKDNEQQETEVKEVDNKKKDSKETKAKKKSSAELKEEKDRKELEAKLEKEAKKRQKEEEKQRKADEKEQKLKAKAETKQAKLEAKKKDEEEKERLKNEAKEAKRLEKLAKKQFKKDKKSGKATATTEFASENIPSTRVVKDSEKFTGSDEAKLAINEGEEVDTTNMTPINTETEVQKIVEETVDEEGVVTRTTKTIETKYVTMQQEEFKTSEHREMPLEEYNRVLNESSDPAAALEQELNMIKPHEGSSRSRSSSLSSKQAFEGNVEKPSTSGGEQVVRLVNIKVEPYEHSELNEIRATPSYFGPQIEFAQDLPEKKVMKKRIKLNNKLIKRAYKLAKNESKSAKKQAKIAESEIAVCDEAAKEAKKELKRALKEKKRAIKVATKEHKKMDKVDKKLAKQQKKIEKKQKKLDKRAEKLTKKEAKKREKLILKESKEAKALERKASQKSAASGSKKSIKLEDIGEPVLKSSSRLSIGGGGNISSGGIEGMATEMVREVLGDDNDGAAPSSSLVDKSVISFSRSSPESQREGEDIQVEMSLDYNNQPTQQDPNVAVTHSITTTTITETPLDDGRIISEEIVTEQEQVSPAAATADNQEEEASNSREEKTITQESDGESEEIDVVNNLPDHFKKNRQTELAD